MSLDNAIDDDLGINPQEGLAAVDRLYPVIQNVIASEDNPEVVIVTLGEAFFICLKMAGASSWQIEKWSKRVYGKIRRSTNFGSAVQSAYEPLANEIKAMDDEGFEPLAIAWAFSGAILDISGQILGRDSSGFKWLAESLVGYINTVRKSAA